jgi:hypothetical protein
MSAESVRNAELALARVLYEKTEHLDPSGPAFRTWEVLSERERDFYWLCVRAICSERSLLETVTYRGAPTTTS